MTTTGFDSTSGVREIEAIAEAIRTDLDDTLPVRGVGYYSPVDCGTVYLRSDVRREVADETEPLEDAVLESIWHSTLEEHFDDELTGTVRFFDHMVAVYAAVGEHRGVVITFDRTRELDLGVVDDLLDERIPDL